MARPRVSIRCCPSGGGADSPLTTKGDLYTFDVGYTRLPVGTDEQVLTADSSSATGLKWATPSGGGGLPAGGAEFQLLATLTGGSAGWSVYNPLTKAIAIGTYDAGGGNASDVAIGSGAAATGSYGVSSVAIGSYAKALGLASVSVGSSAYAEREQTVIVGGSAWSKSEDCVSIGFNARIEDEYSFASVAIGADAAVRASHADFEQPSGVASIAIGAGASSDSNYGITLGVNAQSYESTGSVTIGTGATSVETLGGIAIGAEATVQAQEAIAIGVKSQAWNYKAGAIGPRDSTGIFSTNTTADYRMTLGYRELEVGHPGEQEDYETALILRSEKGQQYRLYVDYTGALQIDPL